MLAEMPSDMNGSAKLSPLYTYLT